MNEKGSRGRDQNFSIGGSVIGSPIGDHSTVGNVTVSSTGETNAASLEDLREAIALLRAEIEAASGSGTTDTAMQYELRQVEDELDEEEPDGETVRVGGKRLQKLLDPLQHVASIAQLTDRVLTLIRTLFAAN